jgi:hypothetical protein
MCCRQFESPCYEVARWEEGLFVTLIASSSLAPELLTPVQDSTALSHRGGIF